MKKNNDEDIQQKVKHFIQKHLKMIRIVIVGLLFGFSLLFMNNTEIRDRHTGTVDLSKLITEDSVTFEQDKYKDKNLVITFTRSSCPHCDIQAKVMNELQKKHDFEHFWIPVNESHLETKKHFDQLGTNYTLLNDPGSELAKKLQVKVVPTTIIKRAGETEFEAIEGIIEAPKNTSQDEKTNKMQPTMNDLLNK